MANVKISELPAATTLDGTEEIPVVQAAGTAKATVADILGAIDDADIPASIARDAEVTTALAAKSDTTHDHDADYDPIGAAAAAAAALVDAAPGALDTLNELAAALGDDANYAATVTTALAGKSATGHTHTGTYEPSGTVATHEADTTAVHGIADTSALSLTSHTHSGTLVATDFDAAGDLLVGTGADTYARFAKGSALQVLRVNAGATALEYADPSGGSVLGTYGDGADGVVNFDGSATVLGLAPSSSVYTLTRDIFLASGSQVSGSAVIKCANFRIFCNGTFTVGASAVVHNDGLANAGQAASTATAAGTVAANSTGGAGGVGTTGGAASTPTNGLGGSGGDGGASSGGGVGGGSTAAIVAPTAVSSMPRSLVNAFIEASANGRWMGGRGGRGGTAAASSTGGGGGSAGSVLYVIAYNLVVAGLLRAAGGVGGPGTGAGTGAGGGAGGGGGALILIYHTKSGAGSTFTAATNAPGGTGGAPQGAGATGATGSNGNIYEIVN